MAQPKEPPLSIRLGAARLARIEAWAKSRKLSRHLAILTLLDEGLRALGKGHVDPVRHRAAFEEPPPEAEKPAPFKTRLKGEWKAP